MEEGDEEGKDEEEGEEEEEVEEEEDEEVSLTRKVAVSTHKGAGEMEREHGSQS